MVKRKLWVAGLIAGAMVFGGNLLTPVSVNAEGSPESPNSNASESAGGGTVTSSPETTKWDHSKSKTATNLNENYKSNVTLSLPSAEEKLESDVVFVVDTSSCSSDAISDAEELIDKAYNVVSSNNAKLKVGVVQFHGFAAIEKNLQELNSENLSDIKSAIGTRDGNLGHGTNFPSGLEAAKQMLEEDNSVSSNRKYMIAVTDGNTYTYINPNNLDTQTNKPNFKIGYSRQTNKSQGAGALYEWPAKYLKGDARTLGNRRPAEYSINNNEEFDDVDFPYNNFKDYFNYVLNIPDVRKFDDYDQEFKDAGSFASSAPVMGIKDVGTADAKNQVINVDKSMVQSFDEIQSMEKSGITCYTFQTGDKQYPVFNDFIEYINNDETISFDNIGNDILYLIGAGSKVTDYMGYNEAENYNFDLVDPESMTMTIDNADTGEAKTLTKTDLGNNLYGFGDILENNKYPYTVQYVPDKKDDNEHIVWTMNVPVSNFEHVQLHYTVKLMNPNNKPDTYGQYDEDGSKNYNDLATNKKAILSPVDSEGNQGADEYFNQPTVSYTVEAPAHSEEPVNPTEPTATPSQPTKEPATEPTATPSQPTEKPTVEPALEPTVEPITEPTVTPSQPTKKPTVEPTVEPTIAPATEPAQSSETVVKPSETATPSASAVTKSTAKSTVTSKPVEKKDSSSPDTGDHSDVLLYAGVIVVMIGIIGVVISIRRKSEN